MPRTEMSPDLVQKSAQALVVGAEMDRWGRPIRTSAYEVWTKVSQTDTSQQWSLFEGRVPSGLAVPLHLHHGQEEWFWVLGGSFVFEVGGQIHRLREGMSLLIPRQIPHRWKKTNDADGRLLILAQPADRLENFFERMAGLSAEQQQDAAVWRSLYADCRMNCLDLRWRIRTADHRCFDSLRRRRSGSPHGRAGGYDPACLRRVPKSRGSDASDRDNRDRAR